MHAEVAHGDLADIASGVVAQVWLAVGQSLGVSTGTMTSPMGVGAALGPWKPDVQLPIPEKTEASVYMAPYTIYRPKMSFHRKGEQQPAGSSSSMQLHP